MIALEMYAGTDRSFSVTVTHEDGTPVNLTGCKLWFTMKRRDSDADAAAVFQATTLAGTVTVADPTTGIAIAAVPSVATDGLRSGIVVLSCDWKLLDATGKLSIVDKGTLKVYPTTTRARTQP